jgi:hypothetical protein
MGLYLRGQGNQARRKTEMKMTLEKIIADRIRAHYARTGETIPYTINETLTDEQHGREDDENGYHPHLLDDLKKIQDEMIVDGKLTVGG